MTSDFYFDWLSISSQPRADYLRYRLCGGSNLPFLATVCCFATPQLDAPCRRDSEWPA